MTSRACAVRSWCCALAVRLMNRMSWKSLTCQRLQLTRTGPPLPIISTLSGGHMKSTLSSIDNMPRLSYGRRLNGKTNCAVICNTANDQDNGVCHYNANVLLLNGVRTWLLSVHRICNDTGHSTPVDIARSVKWRLLVLCTTDIP